MPRAQQRGLFGSLDAQDLTAKILRERPKDAPAPTPFVEAIRPVWRDLKAQASERTLVLVAQTERRLLWAIDGDAATLRRFVPGKLPCLNTPTEDGVYLRIEDRTYLVSLAKSEGFDVMVFEFEECESRDLRAGGS